MNLTLCIPTRATKIPKDHFIWSNMSGNQSFPLFSREYPFLEPFVFLFQFELVDLQAFSTTVICNFPSLFLEIPFASLLCWLPCLLKLISSFLIYFFPLVDYILQQPLVSPSRLRTPRGLCLTQCRGSVNARLSEGNLAESQHTGVPSLADLVALEATWQFVLTPGAPSELCHGLRWRSSLSQG